MASHRYCDGFENIISYNGFLEMKQGSEREVGTALVGVIAKAVGILLI